MNEDSTQEKISPAVYYKGLDHAVKMLFKREAIKRLEWSDRTFALRMKTEEFRPAELMMLESIITNKTFLNV